MATVYLHIGAPKTATSSLQSMLSANYEHLLSQGVLYPKYHRHGDAHHTLVCDLIQDYQGHTMADLWYGDSARGEAWQELRREIEQHRTRVDKIILSSELFFGQTSRLKEMLADISQRLIGHDLKVVVFLRRQDQWYSSFFNQDVKGVRQWAENAYEFYQTHQIFQHEYGELVNIWGEAVGQGNILIRPYESSQWVGGNIVEDFCAVTGIQSLGPGRSSVNESLGSIQLYIKRSLNRIGYEKSDNESVLEILQQVWPEPPLKDCIYINKTAYRRLRRTWVLGNKVLSDRYLQGEPLFSTAIPSPDKVKIYQPQPQQILRCLLALYDFFDHRSERRHRELFARAMLLMLAEYDLWNEFGPQRRSTLIEWI